MGNLEAFTAPNETKSGADRRSAVIPAGLAAQARCVNELVGNSLFATHLVARAFLFSLWRTTSIKKTPRHAEVRGLSWSRRGSHVIPSDRLHGVIGPKGDSS
jgi:hypothetical protein